MEDRAKAIKSLRPVLGLSKDKSDGNEINLFQTEVLRPILKFQNNLLVEYFKSKAFQKVEPLNQKQLVNMINASLTKDINLRNLLSGMVVGLFSEDELRFYIDHQKEIIKRIISMLKHRLENQLSVV